MTVKINALLAYTSKTFTFDSLTCCILQHMVNKIVIHQRHIFERENREYQRKGFDPIFDRSKFVLYTCLMSAPPPLS